MNGLDHLVGKPVELEISGKTLPIRGNLVEFGSDILVIYDGSQFLYIPSIHVQNMKPALNAEFETANLPEMPLENQVESISYRKMLMNAKGRFVEIYTVGNQSIHGYLMSIMSDYLVFQSPIFHTVLISLNHLKYVIPYNSDSTPYSLTQEHFLEEPSGMTPARRFKQQLKKLEGEFVVLDLGGNPNKIGVLKKVEGQTLELITANGSPVYLHLKHVKTIHLPK